MNKVYIASPFFTRDQLFVVTSIEIILEQNKINYYSPRKLGMLKDMSRKEREKAAKIIFASNLDEVDQCEQIICVVDNFDPGTMVELGFALCLRRKWKDMKIITYSAKGYGLNVMLAEASDCHLTDLTKLPLALVGGISDKAESIT